jgi:hypothetical protein
MRTKLMGGLIAVAVVVNGATAGAVRAPATTRAAATAPAATSATPRVVAITAGVPVGVPDEDVGTVVNAGALYVFPYGNNVIDGAHALVLTEATLGVPPRTGDRFGAAVALIDYDHKGAADLAIGAPGRNHGAGVVYILPANSSHTGYDYVHKVVLSQGSHGIAGTAEQGDAFGATLYSGASVNVPWFAIGVPGEDVGSVIDAGVVVVVAQDLVAAPSLTVYPGHGAPRTPQAHAAFGSSFAGAAYALTVGEPGRDLSGSTAAGEVDVLGLATSGSRFPGTGPSSTIHEGAGGMPGTPRSGDRFGAALGNASFGVVAIGIPGRDRSGLADVGAVATYPFTVGSLQYFYEGVGGVPGAQHAGAHFGATVVNDPGTTSFFAGAPGAPVAGHSGAGVVHMFNLNNGSLDYPPAESTVITSSSLGLPAASGDGFGGAIGSGNSPDWAVFAAPGHDRNGVRDVGAIVIALGVGNPVNRHAQVFVQGVGTPGTPEAADRFGSSLLYLGTVAG